MVLFALCTLCRVFQNVFSTNTLSLIDYSFRQLKQHFERYNVALLDHIIPTESQSFFPLTYFKLSYILD
jgi:hypothetical protein